MAREAPSTTHTPVIFDTDVLVYYLRGDQRAADFVRSVPYAQRKLSTIAYMELIQGVRDRREMQILRQDLQHNFSELIAVSQAISDQAVRLMEQYALSHGLRVADALIAATALVCDYRLATANARHYRQIERLELVIYRP